MLVRKRLGGRADVSELEAVKLPVLLLISITCSSQSRPCD